MGTQVTVKFNKGYCASRGNAIYGTKGDVKSFPDSEDLEILIKNKTVEKVKKGTKASKRETATQGKGETS